MCEKGEIIKIPVVNIGKNWSKGAKQLEHFCVYSIVAEDRILA